MIWKPKNFYIGFDFSINKPACCIVRSDTISNWDIKFFIWPIHLSSPEEKLFSQTDIFYFNRNLESISKKSKLSTSEMVLEHTKRSIDLVAQIIKDIKNYILTDEIDENINIYVASEGLSFASVGNSSLDLATYKGVLLTEIYKNITQNIYTYAPITIKKVAGKSAKNDLLSKNPIIDSFKYEPFESKFKDMLKNGELIAKTNYIKCVDDICDSYFACKTLYVKENFQGIKEWDSAKEEPKKKNKKVTKK